MRGALDLRDDRLLQALIGRPSRAASLPPPGFDGETVLLTGAGGSVGSELARQIGARSPARLVLLDHSEYALFRIEQEMRERIPSLMVEPVLVDVTRRRDVDDLVARVRPDAVYHAAAYKHVWMLERDVLSAVRANVFGTLHVAAAARRAGARFLLVSSDKAANPRSVMGASKRLAEQAVLSGASRSAAAVVRFGNVAGSSGSVLEVMLDRIRRGVAVQVTDREATRYFMTAGEAVSLVLEADRLRRTGDIFWLDMGEPVSILALAERLIRHAAAAGLPQVPIEFIGLRPGEKLREELTVQGLELVRTPCDGIWIARQEPVDGDALRACLRALRQAVREHDAAEALRLLALAVPEYEPSSEACRLATARAPARAYRSAGASVRSADTPAATTARHS
jgi:FlaA1/EpsC-like NDP-sugar epimerase